MEDNKKQFYSDYSLKEPIIEYFIGGVIAIAFVVITIITGFYWGYLFILIPSLFFIIDGFLTHRRIIRYRKQKQEKQNNNNPL